MKMGHFIWIYIIANFCFPSGILAQRDEQEHIVVKLSTESSLSPLYLLPIAIEQTELSDSYIRQLEQVLTFDLKNDAAIALIQRSAGYEQIGQSSATNQLGSLASWKEKHVQFVVKLIVQGNSVVAFMLDVERQSLKKTEPFALTGNLGQDRRQIHTLADVVHKAFIGTEGIASTHILYTMSPQHSLDSKNWISEVWESDYDGGNARKITQKRSYCVTPVYLPPKPGYQTGGFLYVSYQLGQPRIYIASSKDGKSSRLSYLTGNQLMPAISRQRDKVAFICDVTGNTSIFLQNFSPENGPIGKPQQIYSARHGTQGSPTFSPDGKRLAFVSDKDGSPKIYIMDIPSAGTPLNEIKPMLITKRNRENSAPSWSPDGKKLAYCSKTKGDRQIWVYDFDSKQEVQITQGAGNKENPSWAHDSLHLVFNSSEPNVGELFIMHLNQTEPTKISFGSGLKCFPNWEPRVFH